MFKRELQSSCEIHVDARVNPITRFQCLQVLLVLNAPIGRPNVGPLHVTQAIQSEALLLVARDTFRPITGLVDSCT